MSEPRPSPGRRAWRNLALILALILGPVGLSLAVVGSPPPAGRSSESTSRVGHKAYYLLLQAAGLLPQRFARGVEAPPAEPGVFVALEPGPSLYRGRGRYARGLLEWVRAGNGALLTLGPDPDRDAESDDRSQVFGAAAQRALDAAQRIRDEAQARAERRAIEERAAREEEPAGAAPAGSAVGEALTAAEPNTAWDPSALGVLLGLGLDATHLTHSASVALPLTGPLAPALADGSGGGPTLRLTRPRVFRFSSGDGPPYQVLLSAAGRPVLVELALGAGRVLLLSEPRLLQNGALDRGAHARLGVRAVERLAEHAGGRRVYFEEFSHGGRELANIFELAWKTRARWPMGQVVLAALVLVLGRVARRRSALPFEVPPRRSRHEAIDAMASLYLRAGDVRGAAEAMVRMVRLRLSRRLGMKAEQGGELSRAVAVRLSRSTEEVRRLLTADGVGSNEELVRRAALLARLREELERHG